MRRKAQSKPFPIRKVARAVLYVYRGANITDALLTTGIPRPTLYQWLSPSQQWPDGDSFSLEAQTFAARVRQAFGRAQALRAVKMQLVLPQASKLAAGERDWRAAHEWLKHSDATRARWREDRQLKIEHAGSVSHEHRVARELTDEALIELAPEEWREWLEEPST